MRLVTTGKKRTICRAGRRGGKTTGAATKALTAFGQGRRVLYAVPTADQVGRFWFEIKRALAEPIEHGYLRANETMRFVEVPGTENRIRAKTAWNADSLRGDYADLLILDEWQLMDEDAWEYVGAPMLVDNNGDAVFIYTPPSLHSRSVSKARDPRHAARMFKTAQNDPDRWEAIHFTSHENPYISREGLEEITRDMTSLAYRQEIGAEDVDEAPGALWTRAMIDANRVIKAPDLSRVVIGVDPPGGVTECGIIAAGIGSCDCKGNRETHMFVLEDRSAKTSPEGWAEESLTAYFHNDADRILGEKNFGGDMVKSNILRAARSHGVSVAYKDVQASRGKAVRAEPIAAAYERGEVHHVGSFPALEDEMCLWIPGETTNSPNRMDALVWAGTELLPMRNLKGPIATAPKASRWRPS